MRRTEPVKSSSLKESRTASIAMFCSAFRFPLSAFGFCLLLFAGCSYKFGSTSLYPCDIRTIYVPMFEADTFRRGLGERLTEAVVREIEAKTPYKVVSSPVADSTLTCRIVAETKGTLLNAPTAEPRNIQLNYRVDVTWTDRRGQQLQSASSLPVPSSLATVDQSTFLIPEAGQTMATSQQQLIDSMAKQIVSLMESPW